MIHPTNFPPFFLPHFTAPLTPLKSLETINVNDSLEKGKPPNREMISAPPGDEEILCEVEERWGNEGCAKGIPGEKEMK